jgi:hypothetical protein
MDYLGTYLQKTARGKPANRGLWIFFSGSPRPQCGKALSGARCQIILRRLRRGCRLKPRIVPILPTPRAPRCRCSASCQLAQLPAPGTGFPFVSWSQDLRITSLKTAAESPRLTAQLCEI